MADEMENPDAIAQPLESWTLEDICKPSRSCPRGNCALAGRRHSYCARRKMESLLQAISGSQIPTDKSRFSDLANPRRRATRELASEPCSIE